MKKLTVLFSMIFCFVMCSFAQVSNIDYNQFMKQAQQKQQEETQNNKQEETPKSESGVVFDKLVYDYGTIEKGSDGKCVFVFTNTTDTPLILTNVQASCGCTVPTWPREAINPGESNKIDMKYNTNNVGHFTKRISVFTNKQNTPIILMIKGSVVEATVVPSTEETK